MSNNYTPNHSHSHGHNPTYNPNYVPPNQPPYFYPPQPYPPHHRGRGGPTPYPTYIPPASFPYPSAYQPAPPINYYNNPYNPSAPSSVPPVPSIPSPQILQTTPKIKKSIQITKSDGTVPEFAKKLTENSPSAPTSAAGSTASSPLSSNTTSPLASPAVSAMAEKKGISLTKKDGAEVKFDRDLKEISKEHSPSENKDNNNKDLERKKEEEKSNNEKKVEVEVQRSERVNEVNKEKEIKEEKNEIKNDKVEKAEKETEKQITDKATEQTTEKTENEKTDNEEINNVNEANNKEEDIEDSWENRQEEDLADLQLDNRDDIENFDPNRVWRPDFEDGERVYTLEFLTKFQGCCKDKPEGMASFDINVEYRGGGDWRGSRNYGNMQSSGGGGRDRERGGRGGGGGGQSRNSPKSPHRGGYRDRDRDSNYMKKSRDRAGDNRENPLVKKSNSLSKVELVLKTAKGLLNKLTFEKFNSLSEKIVNVGIDEETLEPIIKLVFEKAVTEPKYSMMYTKLCKILSVKYPTYQRNGETISFRRILLNKCQEEFENKKKIDPSDPNLSKEEIDELDFKIRLRMKGNITFIGELFKEKMLNDQIIHYCINHLLGDINNPDPANIEGLCKFFTTIGKMLDSEKNKEKIDKYFEKLKFIKDKSNLSVRIKFAIDDVFDLRRNKWVPRRADEAPDTIKGVHKSIESKQSNTPPSSPHRNKDKRNLSSSKLSADHRKGEHSNSNSNLYLHSNNNNNVNNMKDARDHHSNRDSNNNLSNSNYSVKKFQPEKKNQFNALPQNAPSSSLSPLSTPTRDLSEKEMINLLRSNIDEFLSGQSFEMEDYRDIKLEVVDVVLQVFLYLISKNLDAQKIANLFAQFLTLHFITPRYFVTGLNKVLENYEDYAEDFPKLSSRIAIILNDLISTSTVSLTQLAELDTDNLIIPFLLRREIRDQFVNVLSNFYVDLAAESVKKEAFQFLTLLAKSREDEFNKDLLSKVNLSGKENDFLLEVSSLLKSPFSEVGTERVKKIILGLNLINEQKLNELLH